jgi:hypothetical protein
MAIPVKEVKTLHLLLNRLNMMSVEDKEAFAWQYSNGRTYRTSELTLTEYKQLIKDLQALFSKQDTSNTMRRKMISHAHEMSWTVGVDGKIKADMKRLNNWCVKFGYLHKPLNEYTMQELPTLLTQFDRVYSDYLKKV